MIWESRTVMTAIDLAVVGLTSASLVFILKHGRLRGSHVGGRLVLGGLIFIGGFYLVDLTAMWVLPGLIGMDTSLQFMRELHLEYSWIVIPMAVGAICTGFLVNHHALRLTSQQVEKATGALVESEGRFRALFEQAAASIAVIDLDGWITLSNTRLQRLLGYSAESLSGRRLVDLVHPDDRAEVIARLEPLARDEKERTELEARLVTSAGSIVWIHSTQSSIRSSSGEAIARIALLVDISERKRLEQDVLTVAESERKRLGLDLHDGLGQLLTGLGLMVKAVEAEIERGGGPVPGGFDELGEIVSEALSQTRFLARGLLAVPAADADLGHALVELSETAESLFGRRVRVDVDPRARVRSNEATHLYMIAREAVTNSVRHGGAINVWIDLRCIADAVRLSVRDDGHGIPDDADRSAGVGLRSMRIRAAELGGHMEIRALEEGGTEIACSVPCLGCDSSPLAT